MIASTSTVSDGVKFGVDDGVVDNEALVINPVVSRISGEKVGDEVDTPTDVVVKDLAGPPDGGYGWIVVMYIPPN